MRNKTESEKLSGYSQALSKLEPEEQLKKMRAVKSPDTVRRFLSEDAPDELVHRFCTRINGTIEEDLSFFERGRVAFELQNYSYARGQFMEALKQGDRRARYYLARLDHAVGDILSAEGHYKDAWLKGYHKGECLMSLAEIAVMKDQPLHAIGTLHHAVHGKEKAVRDYCTLRIAQIMDSPINEEKELLKLAKAGNEHACDILFKKYIDEDNDEGVMQIGERLARMGYTIYYQIVAKFLSTGDDIENAKKYHVLAIRAGYDSSYPLIVNLLSDAGRNDEAIDYCKEALKKGHKEAYYPLLTLLQNENRSAEVLQYMSHALYNGFDDVHSLLDLIDTNDTVKNVFARETQTALMRGENLHPTIIERFLRIKMEAPPSGPLN